MGFFRTAVATGLVSASFLFPPAQATAGVGDFLMSWPISQPAGFAYNHKALAVDGSGQLFHTDYDDMFGDPNEKVWVYDTETGTLLRTFSGFGRGEGVYFNSAGIDVAPDGNVYLSDMSNHRVLVFANDGTYLRQIGSYGTGEGQLQYPVDLALDRLGRVYVADYQNNRVAVFDSQGVFLHNIGGPGSGDGFFSGVWGVEVTAEDKVYVADVSRCDVQVFEPSGAFLFKFGGQGGGFGRPRGIASDGAGHVFVADEGGTIQAFDSAGAPLTLWGSYGSGPGQMIEPMNIDVDRHGRLYLMDALNGRIQVFSAYRLLVESLPVTTVSKGTMVSGVATARVVDESGSAVPGARVTGHWEGLTADLEEGLTGPDGLVAFSSDGLRRPLGTFRFTVDSVTAPGRLLDPADSVLTGSAAFPPPPVCTDADADGFFLEGGGCGPADCNELDSAVNPGALESCSNLTDDDCDGAVDCLDRDCRKDPACR